MRSPSRLLVPVVVLLAAACGGEDLPTVDAAVAEDLAGRADVLAGQLEAGDACAARETAGALVTVTSEARDAGTVPAAIAGEVIGTTRDLVRDVTCPPPAPDPAPAPPADDDGRDEDPERGERGKSEAEGQGKGKGEGKGDDGKGKDDDKDDD